MPSTEGIEDLIARMTLREKIGQLGAVWLGATPDDQVAPHQDELSATDELEDLLQHGIGQVTRAFGTLPVDAGDGAAALVALQRRVVAANRFGIPALVHEECLSGFTTWGASVYPVPLAWGATFNPDIVERMAIGIGASMRAVGVHQGLAPVLDVTRDPRWGRTEETIGEDPYLVGTIAAAYVRGLESTGIIATLKHFAGYSGSRGARNLAPALIGPREFADVILLPFEMVMQDGHVRSVMHSYAEVDGVPAAADERLLTRLLRDEWRFEGTVVADYFGIGFLKIVHGVAGTFGEAAAQALVAGVDVELPAVKTYAEPLLEEIAAGRVDEAFVDRALRRVLDQKAQIGLLDPNWSPLPDGWDDEHVASPTGLVELDPDESRAVARDLAEQSIVLLSNDGSLPLSAPARIAVIGPTAADPMTLVGCYAFPNHVGVHHPELDPGVRLVTVANGLRTEFPDAHIDVLAGCDIDGPEDGRIDAAVEAARAADTVILCLGDRAGLFGRGTSGEGCDALDLALPGVQSLLLEKLLDTGTRVIVVLVAGRPYALGTAPERAAAIVQVFFPGEEGGTAVARVLSGASEPSGRLPVSVPVHAGGQPWTYLTPPLGARSEVSNIDPSPAYPFGHGLTYTTFAWTDASAERTSIPTDGELEVGVSVRNTGARHGVEIVQLYLHDPVASVTRPIVRMIGYARVPLAAGESARVSFNVSADMTAFTGRDSMRIVEPGAIELRLGASSTDIRASLGVQIEGPVRTVGFDRHMTTSARITLQPDTTR
ncbi:beta-glucosidase family protein [Microbacterium aoyamense]|uniref:beta-xylosidase/alpha-l-arabinosidase n=1 Tax=Microbacterium aoyamense TaxID=344166 RepID=UPI002005CB50|nr:glycoside hydrolase family 3 N-terminal domain-containing protein [Microbacterium aoyamense]